MDQLPLHKAYNKEQITVYTPTYNRAYCLHKLYNSLLRQTNKNFIWLIIDDGSTDKTSELVETWKSTNQIKVQYYYQKNAGKMQAVNYANTIMITELNVCMDSDDYMTNDAIEKILYFWKKYGSDEYAGLVGLARYEDGTLVGTGFPESLKFSKFSYFASQKIKGDKIYVYRTDLVQKYPSYPKVKNEHFPAPAYLYRLIDVDYNLLLFNDVWSVVEYMPDGISRNKITQLKKNPNAFAYYRKERMRLAINYMDKFKNAIHFVTSCLLAKDYKSIFERKYLSVKLFVLPISIILFIVVLKTYRTGVINGKKR
jgi:glycosyltransferase involved in cell wall biosynthesis